MLTELSPTLTRATVAVKPEDLLLKKGSWVKFTKSWAGDQLWAANNTFEVINEPLIVRYPISRKAPTGHYCNLDLSNLVNPSSTTPAATANFSWQMYPVQTNALYQIAVGFKPGNYWVQTYIPSNKYIYTVGSTSIYPDVNSSIWRYLGVKYPKDSPEESPVWFLYTLWNMVPIILRLYCDGPDYDKMTLVFKLNKCQLAPKKLTESEQSRALLIEYYTDLVGF
jgi:hypothetical protein